jgi:YHS domain-containing protein
MVRVVLLVFVVFMFLTVLRGLRIFLAAFLGRPRPGAVARGGGPRDGEMVRDPVCGTWVDRGLALAGRRGGETVSVCSEKCRATLEAGAQAP